MDNVMTFLVDPETGTIEDPMALSAKKILKYL